MRDPTYSDLPTANGRMAPAVWDGNRWVVLQGTTNGSMNVSGDVNALLIRSNVTEVLMEDEELSSGINHINFEALGNSFGIGIYLEQSSTITFRMTYIIPGTVNYTLEPYRDIFEITNNDRGVYRVDDLRSSHVRMILRNEGESPVKVKSLHVTHFL